MYNYAHNLHLVGRWVSGNERELWVRTITRHYDAISVMMHSWCLSLTHVHPFLQSPEFMTDSNYLFDIWSSSPGYRDISDAFCNVSRNPCSLYLLVHFWTNLPPTMIKGLFNIPLDILILILFNSLILSFKHFMADIMGQTVHQVMSDSIIDTAECM